MRGKKGKENQKKGILFLSCVCSNEEKKETLGKKSILKNKHRLLFTLHKDFLKKQISTKLLIKIMKMTIIPLIIFKEATEREGEREREKTSQSN